MALKLLVGTTNPVKIAIVQAAVCVLPIDLLTPADLKIEIHVDESGQTPQENAVIKARAYCMQANLPTLAIDGGLWIEKFPPEKQPGARVKRILDNDEEGDILAYYIHELATVGGESPCIWESGLALVFPDHRLITETYQTRSTLTSKAHGTAIPGIALSPITIDSVTGIYHSEMSLDKHPDVQNIRQFMQKIIGTVQNSEG